jgi:ABC-2 type transport system permease protein
VNELRLHLAAFSAALKAKLEYRADFVIGAVTSVLLQLAAMSFLMILFHNTENLNGWNGPQVVFLFGATATCLGVSELLFNHIWMLPQYVVSGDLDRLLTYPVHALSFFLVTRPELHSLGNLVTGGLLVGGALSKVGAPFHVWLLVPFWIACGSIVYTSMLVVFGSLSFRLVGPYGHQLMVPHNLLQSTRYPLAVYPGWLHYVLLVAVPVGVFHFLPGSYVFGMGASAWSVFAPPLAAFVAVLEARWMWRWGLAQYESTGS